MKKKIKKMTEKDMLNTRMFYVLTIEHFIKHNFTGEGFNNPKCMKKACLMVMNNIIVNIAERLEQL